MYGTGLLVDGTCRAHSISNEVDERHVLKALV